MKNAFWAIILLLAGQFLLSCGLVAACKQTDNRPLNLSEIWQTEAVFNNPESVVFDPVAKILIVSNANGPAMKKDGNGYLSKVALNGKVLDQTWLTGLDAPKGMALKGNSLYIADIRNLVVVDLTSGLMDKYKAPGAKFLKDVAIDAKGRVFISDLYTDTIYIFEQKKLKPWLRNRLLASPNGLYVTGNTLYVGSWGVRKCALETETPGHLLKVNLITKAISDVGKTPFSAHIDGVEMLGNAGFLVTDRIKGSLLHLNQQGEFVESLPVGEGAADLHFLPQDWELVVVPMATDNVLKAFKLPVQ